MKAKSKISVYILRSAAVVLLLSCVIVAFSSAVVLTLAAASARNQAQQKAADAGTVLQGTHGRAAVLGPPAALKRKSVSLKFAASRIYDVATNTWTTGPNMPDVRSFSAGGFIAAIGNIYIISGYDTGQVTSAQPNTYAYDPVARTNQSFIKSQTGRDIMLRCPRERSRSNESSLL